MYSYQLMNYSGMLGRTPVKVGAARRLAKGEAASDELASGLPSSVDGSRAGSCLAIMGRGYPKTPKTPKPKNPIEVNLSEHNY